MTNAVQHHKLDFELNCNYGKSLKIMRISVFRTASDRGLPANKLPVVWVLKQGTPRRPAARKCAYLM